MNSFKTRVDLDVNLDRTGDFDVETKTVEISWDLAFDMRSWGVKDIGVHVPDQKITIFLNIWNDETDTEEELVLDVKDVEIERNASEFYSFAPQSLELYKGKWKLVF
jgi:hypothetical protein